MNNVIEPGELELDMTSVGLNIKYCNRAVLTGFFFFFFFFFFIFLFFFFLFFIFFFFFFTFAR